MLHSTDYSDRRLVADGLLLRAQNLSLDLLLISP
ncbi:hypothetical protein MXMO3_01482 [Maritalea myrionectae]|uniref:Uncharacterized protein n=1 Tax=Maritalea myrionectae TaxID=454601 RepID=A0A2R4MDC1_9HYPH|nr:hypothetical protein MXMO3_01482 [Maritalea myrionectae]